MIPKNNKDLTDVLIGEDIEVFIEPSKTFRMDIYKERINGFIDEKKAVEQAIYKILNTERYKYIIYDWNYGVELADLFGKPTPFIHSILKIRIEEALLEDNRIKEVYDFYFENPDKETVFTKFKVDSIFGTIDIEHSLFLRR